VWTFVISNDDYQKAASGDRKAIEKLCLATWKSLYRFIYGKVQNREEAEDITQETYVKALKYLQGNSYPRGNFLSFLKTISLNLIRDRWRHQKKCREASLNFQAISLENTASVAEQDDVAQRVVLECALAKLSPDYRAIVEFRIIKGYSVAETAKRLGKSEGAIRTAQYRALQVLARILEEGEGLSD